MNSEYEYDPKRIVYFGATDARGSKVPFGIRAEDRMRHMYVIGKTGMGKSTMLENLAIQDIQNGEGICFIDPHGGTAEKLLEFVPESRIDDVVYFAPFDVENPVGFNVMEDVGYEKRHLVVAGLMSSFKRIWVDMWSARMEYILQNVLLALLEYPDTTLIDINRMLINKEFRKKVVEYVTDPIVKRFWVEEFAGYGDRYTQEATPAIQNKVGQFASNPLVRNIIAQPKSTFDIRELMDTRKIFIVNLSKGRMGEQNADLLGSMLTTKIYLSAMSRAEETAEGLHKLPPFYLYVDEFQSVVNDSFSNILSEARKYKLSLTIAHQYIEQVDEEIRAAVFGNVGTTIAFRVGPFDAETLKTVFEPTFYAEDLVNLGFAQIYLTLMIDGIGSQPFSATTLPPVENPSTNFVEEIIERSRKKYSRTRASVEEIIRKQDEKLPPGGFEKPASKWPKKKKPTNTNSNGNWNGQKNNNENSDGYKSLINGNGSQNGNKQTQDQKPKQDLSARLPERSSQSGGAQVGQSFTKPVESAVKKEVAESKPQETTKPRAENTQPKEKQTEKKEQPKKPTENKNDLRSALADIMQKNTAQEKPSIKTPEKIQEKPKPVIKPTQQKQNRNQQQAPRSVSKENTNNNANINSSSSQHEVPLEVLDKLLNNKT